LGSARYDLILCNPPYVTSHSMHALPREHRFEPRIALAGGPDGLDVVRRILRDAPAHLARQGLLVCEIGHNRRALERAYPAISFIWPELSVGSGHVFVVEGAQLGEAREPLRQRARNR
jgi:ribosomal protein L3 glutamine methyltransferase